MVTNDTYFRVLVRNDMVRFVDSEGDDDFNIVFDDEFSGTRMEVRLHNREFLVYSFDEEDKPVFVSEEELKWFRTSIPLQNAVAKFVEGKYDGDFNRGKDIAGLLSSAERGKVDGLDTKVSHTLVYAKQVDMGFRYKVVCKFQKADTAGKKLLEKLDEEKEYSLTELVRELQLKTRKAVDWLNSVPKGETVDDFMKGLKADKYSQVLFTVEAGDKGMKKSAQKSVS